MGRKALPRDEMDLTEREHLVLDYLTGYISSRGYPPTVREICQYLGIKSTSTIHRDLHELEKRGFILRDPAKPRTIEILNSGRPDRTETTAPATGQEIDETPYSGAERADVVDIPVIGRVAAGTPILADQNVSQYFPVPASFASGSSRYFMLVVRGESMIEAGIMDGDYILVRQQSEASNGDMVVAMIDGFESEATVKTFYNEGDHIRLQPENHTMSPIIVREVRILGLVRGVFRYL